LYAATVPSIMYCDLYKAIHELIVTEADYVRDLQLIVEVRLIVLQVTEFQDVSRSSIPPYCQCCLRRKSLSFSPTLKIFF